MARCDMVPLVPLAGELMNARGMKLVWIHRNNWTRFWAYWMGQASGHLRGEPGDPMPLGGYR